MLFQKNLSPKHLSISEMWKLYLLLRDALVGEEKEYLISEVIRILENVDVYLFKRAIRLMYGDAINYLEKSPLEIGIMFSDGLKHNNFFDFYTSIKAINVSSR